MKNFSYPHMCFGIVVFLLLSWPVAVQAEDGQPFVTSRYETYQPRRDMVGQALDSYEQNRRVAVPRISENQAVNPAAENLSSVEILNEAVEREAPKTTTVARISESEYAVPGQEVAIRDPQKTMAQQFFDFNDPDNSLDIGLEVFDYSYREEGFMKVDGMMYGLRSEYAHRLRKPYKVGSYDELGKTVMHPTVVKADARVSGMRDGHYRSEGTGDMFDERHYSYELRAMAGYDYYLKNGFTATPYFGFGYRYLLDDNGGRRSTTGHWAYDRESEYFYVPIGVDLARRLTEKWSLKWNAEYDWFLSGRQRSHFEDDPNGIYTQTLSNRQPRGYGARTSVKLSREAELVDFFVEPFVRYWHIDPSKVDCTDEICGIEPNNRTEEYGLRMGVNF